MADTVREKCLQGLKDLLEQMKAHEPADDPYTVTWGKIVRAPLGAEDGRKQYACGIVDGRDVKTHRMPLTEGAFEVFVEFRARCEKGEEASVCGNRVLGEIQRKIGEDRTLGGVALDCTEVRNELDYDNAADKTVEGVIEFLVKYRHATDDPRRAV